MLYMEDRHKNILRNILKKYPYYFYAFGSRIKGTQKEFSDLDLCYHENIPDNIISHIQEDFEESDLPYKVDIVNYNLCSDNFKKIIDNKKLALNDYI